LRVAEKLETRNRRGDSPGRKEAEMAKIKELDPSRQKVDVDMTPMIDCVFLLLIFFMVVSEMSSMDMEAVSLPFADQARAPEIEPEGRRIVINIHKEDAKRGFVRVQGRNYDKDKLAELIRKEAIRSGEEHDPAFAKIKIYKLRVLIRCDREAKYETVQWVFDACSKNGVYKTVISASPETE
jgi:biopolymer transport protein ExbD